MFENDPEGAESFLKELERLADSVPPAGDDALAEWEDRIVGVALGGIPRRPWSMRLTIWAYRQMLLREERRLRRMASAPPSVIKEQVEAVERLRFAVRFGLAGDAEERANCDFLIKRFKVAPAVAPYLVWARVIDCKEGRVNFGHWDWLLGAFIGSLIVLLYVFALSLTLCGIQSIGWFAFYLLFYSLLAFGMLSTALALTVDLFLIGRHCFRPDGLRFDALPLD